MDLPISLTNLAILIFVITYILIASEKINRTIAAMSGAVAMWVLGVIHPEQIFHYIDFNTLGLLFGMMVIVGTLSEAGFFRWVGIHLANFCECKPLKMFIVFSLITAILSAFLDNVTTVLFMVTVTIEIMEILEVDPTPYLISEIMFANIGGVATLIGDPPNIMIATASGLNFNDFLVNLAPNAMIIAGCTLGVLYIFYRKEFTRKVKYDKIPIKPSDAIEDRWLFNIGIVLFLATIVLLFLHELLHIKITTIAMVSATLFLLVGGKKMHAILEDIDWSMLIFITSLLVIVGGIVETGLLQELAAFMFTIIGDSQILAVTSVLWIASLMSGIFNSIAFTATFIPLNIELANIGGFEINQLWWSLAMGAALGGNATIIGSAATVAAISAAAKQKYSISFMQFFKIGFTVTVITTAIANILLVLRFLI